MLKLLIVAIFFLFLSNSLSAQTQKVNLEKDLSSKAIVDLYEATGKLDPTKLKPLSRLKYHQNNLRWTDCVKLAPEVFLTEKSLRGWVALTWFHCLEEKQKKVLDPKAETALLKNMETHKELLQSGPWAQELTNEWVNLKLNQIERQIEKKDSRITKDLDEMLSGRLALSRDQRSKALGLLGDSALKRSDFSESQFFYEAAQDQKDSSYIKEKLDFL